MQAELHLFLASSLNAGERSELCTPKDIDPDTLHTDSWSGHIGDGKILLHLPGTEPRFLGPYQFSQYIPCGPG
jgi:hypothetical protein